MPTRRQEKVARVVLQAVSGAIQGSLSDPRIQGVVSVTRVDMSPDLRNAEVYVSVLGPDEKAQRRTMIALQSATRRLQCFVAEAVKSKFCPILTIREDEKFKKTLETMNLIDKAASEFADESDEENHENEDGVQDPL